MKKEKTHEYYMNLAMRLALRAKGRTFPNPLVGAIVVKSGRIISRGYHKKVGLPHAEVVCLTLAAERANGATLYVTLEPCSCFGRTPACTDMIISSRIKEVIVGMLDPNPRNNGKGIEILREHGIKVEVGFLEEKLRAINQPFIKYITKKLPYVTVKVGQSLDGKIASRSGDSHWVTSDKAREYAHHLRNEFDAIMVGVNTVIRDNPKLDAPKGALTKIIVDSHLSISLEALVLNTAPVVIATLSTSSAQETPNRRLLSQKARILEVKEKEGLVNLRDILKKLAREGVSNILVEGGGNLIGSLFDEDLVDRILFFISPKIIGGEKAISSVMGKGRRFVDQAYKLKDMKLKRIDSELLVEGYVHWYN
ncbi:MAG: bifunctional diaminohydroxyphosphoribosylaminopyrimidine deaminase/5-amino-6-(5-phosphoribosylamino)uracil reductase RibD [Candidatus Omnitrophica bacterium]|nr:bifunctional diaminohydroxyphosphoribosylaminopyrimidine deaminase/5-amino-6-(5-phosphoribosylamino)uracil reductase RibD [Candidatus Omnitrophota bacterium]